MPRAEVEVSSELVADLVGDQAPHLPALPVIAIGFGWDNFSFRVGDELVARLPRRKASVPLVENEARWLPRISPRLPLPVPTPVFVGEPGRGYPWPWTLVPWIAGEPVSRAGRFDSKECADELAVFLRALHQRAPEDAPHNPFRGGPLSERDETIRRRIHEHAARYDEARLLAVWSEALNAPQLAQPPTWLHGDLHPANLLESDGRLSGVLDFGDITAGDPATDLAVAWMLFPRQVRTRFREVYGDPGQHTWERARGWALALALMYLTNSADNDEMRSIGATTLTRIIDDK